MSNHFTYEIDERNLRLQLKNLEVLAKEDSWRKFEIFAESQKQTNSENRFKNFRIPLDRNVILPAIFGVIIVSFSFLLFNFINIKNPKNSSQQRNVNVVAEPVVVKEKAPLPVEKKVIPALVAEVKKDTVIITEPALAEQNTAQELAVEAVNKIDDQLATSISETEREEAEKRKERRRAARLENEQLKEIRPSQVSDESEAEVRPN